MMYQHWIAWQQGKEIYIVPRWIKTLKRWVEIKAETPFRVVVESALGLFCLFALLIVLGIIVLSY